MKIIFFGSSDFSIPSLECCLRNGREVPLVISTPDKRKGRGLKMIPTEVSLFAKEKGLALECPKTLKDENLLQKAKALNPDVLVVASYGKLIPDSWLNIARTLPINVHPSLLPKYRGASPLNWPIINGDTTTGTSVMRVASELDAGEVYAQKEYPLDETMNAQELSDFLAKESVELLDDVLNRIEREGVIQGTPQNHAEHTYARKLEKEDGLMNWKKSAKELANLIRGLQPWPIAYTSYKGDRLQVLRASAITDESGRIPGTLLSIEKDGSMVVQASGGCLKIHTVKPAGKKEMSAADFARGKRLEVGAVFA